MKSSCSSAPHSEPGFAHCCAAAPGVLGWKPRAGCVKHVSSVPCPVQIACRFGPTSPEFSIEPHDGRTVHAEQGPPQSMPASPPFCLPSSQLGHRPHETGQASAAVTFAGANIAAACADPSPIIVADRWSTYWPRCAAHIGCHDVSPGPYWAQPALPTSDTHVVESAQWSGVGAGGDGGGRSGGSGGGGPAAWHWP